MEMTVHNDSKFVEIWLTRSESNDKPLKEKLKETFGKYKDMKYRVAVYRSGSGDLRQSMAALLRHNMELQCRIASNH